MSTNAPPLAANGAPADDEFLRRFEAQSIPRTEWNHRAHLRIAYAYLSRHPLDEAIARMRRGIQALNAVNGVEEGPDRGYHETLTQMWMRILHGLRTAVGPESSFDAFVERHPYVLQKLLARLFYSRQRMLPPDA